MEIEFAACWLIEFYKEEGNTFGTSVLFYHIVRTNISSWGRGKGRRERIALTFVKSHGMKQMGKRLEGRSTGFIGTLSLFAGDSTIN